VAVDQRLDEVLAGREVAIQRADADAGPAGDVVERRLRAPLRERLVGRFEQPGAVALGVGPEGAVLGGAGDVMLMVRFVGSCRDPVPPVRRLSATREIALAIGGSLRIFGDLLHIGAYRDRGRPP
jgi:hypothetical protein